MRLLHEKLFNLKTGRAVKVVANEVTSADQSSSQIEWDILIKEPKDANFHPLIESSHPIYWKIKKLSPLQRKLIELQYAGINKAEIKKVVAELGKIVSGKVHKN